MTTTEPTTHAEGVPPLEVENGLTIYEVLEFIEEGCSDRDLAWIITGADFIARQRAEAPEVAGEGWCPWRELIRRYPKVKLRWTHFKQDFRGLIEWSMADATIHLDPTRVRTAADQAKTLTHELIHDERGVYRWTPEERDAEEERVRELTDERMATWVGR